MEFKWLVKQLLPLSYWTKYGKNGKCYFVIWRMWFGKSFDIEEFEIKK
ncbi:hypothetical protein [Methanobrevibacter arboriphilus]|uniref:Uncharacterized protein n=1 Tax=Methanobrevibacter arboriphilus TaxID=39441 RepID=A0ACA8R1Y8_METAZ|nr:hypothetical protein [Methanobrevibacter arboriphilus]BBL61525.1 hypothetical protein MarbSA_05650 [Methanobrevibacter arboriphilus]